MFFKTEGAHARNDQYAKAPDLASTTGNIEDWVIEGISQERC